MLQIERNGYKKTHFNTELGICSHLDKTLTIHVNDNPFSNAKQAGENETMYTEIHSVINLYTRDNKYTTNQR